MKIRLIAPAIILGTLGLSACGGGGSSAGNTVPANADIVVKAVDPLAWSPTEYTAAVGDVVVVAQNTSSLPHNLHIVDSSGTRIPIALDIPSRNDIESATIAMTAGEYTLICTIPGHSNMKATLTVS